MNTYKIYFTNGNSLIICEAIMNTRPEGVYHFVSENRGEYFIPIRNVSYVVKED